MRIENVAFGIGYLSRLALTGLAASLLGACAVPIALRYQPENTTAATQDPPLKIFVADVADNSGDFESSGRVHSVKGRELYSRLDPPISEAFKTGLVTALGAAGVTIVPGPAGADAILSAQVDELLFHGFQPSGLGLGRVGHFVRMRFLLVFKDTEGRTLWQEPIDGRSQSVFGSGYSRNASIMNEAFADTLKRVQDRLASTDLRAKLRSSHGHVVASEPERPEATPASKSDVDTPRYQKGQNEDAFALVVGISKYRDLPEAEFADRDARAVKKHLMALGYPEQNIVTLIGDHATKGPLEDKLEKWLPMNVNERSTVFVYFSGHGASDPESRTAYLVPWDGDPESLQSTALSLPRFYEDLEKLPAKRVLVALDSCFSGSGGRSVLAKGARPLVTRVEAAVPESGKLVVFTASRADQISGTIEEQGHGAFTYYFLKGLNGEAVSRHRAGHVTVGSLYTYVAPRVDASAHRHERDQQPQILPSLDRSAGIEIR